MFTRLDNLLDDNLNLEKKMDVVSIKRLKSIRFLLAATISEANFSNIVLRISESFSIAKFVVLGRPKFKTASLGVSCPEDSTVMSFGFSCDSYISDNWYTGLYLTILLYAGPQKTNIISEEINKTVADQLIRPSKLRLPSIPMTMSSPVGDRYRSHLKSLINLIKTLMLPSPIKVSVFKFS